MENALKKINPLNERRDIYENKTENLEKWIAEKNNKFDAHRNVKKNKYKIKG